MTPTDSLPLRDIHDLTTNYSDRQGLRIVPIGLALVMQTLPQVPTSLFGIDIMLIAMAIGLGGYFAIGKYYRRRFGTVEEIEGDSAYLFAGYLVLGDVHLLRRDGRGSHCPSSRFCLGTAGGGFS
ncbi:MAG TPA: hypothetical protein VER58_04515 [Thermoanaerobaculia bacterium]|nr:hypothetical protein [Thermoanaerobaculia bacterium]